MSQTGEPDREPNLQADTRSGPPGCRAPTWAADAAADLSVVVEACELLSATGCRFGLPVIGEQLDDGGDSFGLQLRAALRPVDPP